VKGSRPVAKSVAPLAIRRLFGIHQDAPVPLRPSKELAQLHITNRAAEAFSPTQIAIIDIAGEIPVLSRVRSAGGIYRGAWVLVLEHGEPRRIVEFSFTEQEIGGDALRRLLGEMEESALRLKRPPSILAQQLPYISVVVPTTFSRFDQLENCAIRLSSLDYPSYEVIIVDNRPDRRGGQAERERISSLPNVRVVTEPIKGISAARNCGTKAALGEIIAFTDDDACPHQGWLRSIGSRFAAEPETNCVTGLVVPAEMETVAQEWFENSGCSPSLNLKRYQYNSVARDSNRSGVAHDRFRARRVQDDDVVEHWIYELGSYGMGNNFSFRSEYLASTGGFELSLGVGTPTRGGEDAFAFVELMFNDQTIAYEPSAIVSHTNRRTYSELREQIFSYGLGVTAAFTALACKDPKHLVGYARILGPAINMFRGSDPSTKHGGRPPDFPRELIRLEILGMLAGPFAYAWSRWKYRASGKIIRQ
jgi:glycosyltransferase involved in cell wall biosynthesis